MKIIFYHINQQKKINWSKGLRCKYISNQNDMVLILQLNPYWYRKTNKQTKIQYKQNLQSIYDAVRIKPMLFSKSYNVLCLIS